MWPSDDESGDSADAEGLPAELSTLFSECGGVEYTKAATKYHTPKPGHTQNPDTQNPDT